MTNHLKAHGKEIKSSLFAVYMTVYLENLTDSRMKLNQTVMTSE
jgi:hypothetical protein